MSALAPTILKADPETARLVADRLLAGELAVVPTETVYGLAATPAGLPALRAARARLGRPESGPAAWHAPSVQAALDALRPSAPVHRRIMERLWPGPVTVSLEVGTGGAGLGAVRERIGAPAGMVDDSTRVWARVPSHAWTAALAERLKAPLVAEGAPASSGVARTCEEAMAALARAGVPVALGVDAGPAQIGRPSTLIELAASGGWRVAPGGVYDEKYVRRRIQRTVLFVCTGNTCRSPMAEAIALHEAEKSAGAGGVPTVVRSAGIMGGGGAGTTPETLAALREIGVTVTPSRSKALSRAMVDEADVVFAMTRSHAAAVTEMAPGAASKVHLLNPRGEDIPDPIGAGQERYTALAREMTPMIQRRLREMEP